MKKPKSGFNPANQGAGSVAAAHKTGTCKACTPTGAGKKSNNMIAGNASRKK